MPKEKATNQLIQSLSVSRSRRTFLVNALGAGPAVVGAGALGIRQ